MELENRLRTVIDSARAARVFPGIVLRIERHGAPFVEIAEGWRQVEPSEEAMTSDTVFDLASLTKPLATALLTLIFVERERVSLDARLVDFLPEVSGRTRELTLRNLLLHTSGLPSMPGIYTALGSAIQDPEAARRILFRVKPEGPQGERVVYSCTGFLLLGELLRKQTGRELGELYREWVTVPLGLSDLLFLPPRAMRPRIAATENCRFRNRWIRGEVHDENSWCLGGQAGNAGLFGSAPSISRLLTIFLNRGKVGRKRLLSEASTALMMRSATPGLNEQRSAGFITGWEGCPAGPLAPQSSFGHTGFTGTSVWVLPEQGMTVVTLTNRVHYGRDQTAEPIRAFRKALHGEIFGYLGLGAR